MEINLRLFLFVMRVLLTDDTDKPRASIRRVSKKRHARIGAYSSVGALADLDGRSKEAKFLKRIREELTSLIAGRPNAAQRLLIDRAAILALRCAQIDERILYGEILTAHDNDHAIAWHNAFRRTVAQITNIEMTPEPVASLADLLGQDREVA